MKNNNSQINLFVWDPIESVAAHSTAVGRGCGDGIEAVNAVFERCFNQGK